jgi:hypothetical protein
MWRRGRCRRSSGSHHVQPSLPPRSAQTGPACSQRGGNLGPDRQALPVCAARLRATSCALSLQDALGFGRCEPVRSGIEREIPAAKCKRERNTLVEAHSLDSAPLLGTQRICHGHACTIPSRVTRQQAGGTGSRGGRVARRRRRRSRGLRRARGARQRTRLLPVSTASLGATRRLRHHDPQASLERLVRALTATGSRVKLTVTRGKRAA